MAAPVIRSLTAAKSTLAPGESTTVTFDAYDPDNRVIPLNGEATDAAGNVAVVQATLTVGDPISFKLTSPDTSAVLTQDPANPAKFVVTV